MKSTALFAQVAFIGVAAVTVFAFVRAAQTDFHRAACSAVCELGPQYAGRDRLAPDFELKDMNGQAVRLSSFRGKTVVLNFWTKTCRPCLEEMPSLVELGKMIAGRKDIVLLAVSIDEGPEDVRDTLRVALNGEDPPFQILFDPESAIVGDKYGTKLFPETWLIDPKGVIRARFDGARDWSSSLAVDIAEGLAHGGCPIDFQRGAPTGPRAGLCRDDS